MKHFVCFRFVFAVVYAITVPSFGRKNARHGGLQTKDERRDEIGEVRRLGFAIQEAEPIESIR